MEQFFESKSTRGNNYWTGHGFNSIDMGTTNASVAAADPLYNSLQQDSFRNSANKTTAKPTTAIAGGEGAKALPIMMWNVNDVHVGINKDLAKQFKLKSGERQDIFEMLPKLSVDMEIPYKPTRSRRQSHLTVNAALKGSSAIGPHA